MLWKIFGEGLLTEKSMRFSGIISVKCDDQYKEISKCHRSVLTNFILLVMDKYVLWMILQNMQTGAVEKSENMKENVLPRMPAGTIDFCS